MSECDKILVVAEELRNMVDNVKAKQTDQSIKEIMLGQSLYGVRLSIDTMLKQIQQAISIEEVN